MLRHNPHNLLHIYEKKFGKNIHVRTFLRFLGGVSPHLQQLPDYSNFRIYRKTSRTMFSKRARIKKIMGLQGENNTIYQFISYNTFDKQPTKIPAGYVQEVTTLENINKYFCGNRPLKNVLDHLQYTTIPKHISKMSAFYIGCDKGFTNSLMLYYEDSKILQKHHIYVYKIPNVYVTNKDHGWIKKLEDIEEELTTLTDDPNDLLSNYSVREIYTVFHELVFKAQVIGVFLGNTSSLLKIAKKTYVLICNGVLVQFSTSHSIQSYETGHYIGSQDDGYEWKENFENKDVPYALDTDDNCYMMFPSIYLNNTKGEIWVLPNFSTFIQNFDLETPDGGMWAIYSAARDQKALKKISSRIIYDNNTENYDFKKKY